ncbi:MAG: MipA/OmpV family protein [Gammaproteobacteria bacterium]|nr:MipA/OmpV family protein [Gammaproteobacteria bacterium]
MSLGITLIKDPGVSVAVILKPTFAGYSASDSDALDGMSDTSYLLNTGLQMQYRLMPLSFTVEALHDVTGRSTGNTLSGELATIFPIDDQRFTVIPSVTAVWQSSDITNYYYGVSGSEVTASRPEYSPAGATTIHYGLTLKYRVSDHLGTTFGYTLTQLPRAISDSPIVSRSTSSSLLAGASYIFLNRYFFCKILLLATKLKLTTRKKRLNGNTESAGSSAAIPDSNADVKICIAPNAAPATPAI